MWYHQRSIEQLKKTVKFRDKTLPADDPDLIGVKEGFFEIGLSPEEYRKKWKAKRDALKIGDVEMPDIEPAAEVMPEIQD